MGAWSRNWSRLPTSSDNSARTMDEVSSYVRLDLLSVRRQGRPKDCSASSSNPMMEGPWCRFRREARAPSDIDTVVVDSLKALDPKRPIREADIRRTGPVFRFVPIRPHRTLGGAASHRDLGVRRPAPLVEPSAILRRHLRALRLRRMPLTRRCLLAVLRRGPPHLDAVVRAIGHFEECCPVDDLLERKRPLRAIAAGVGYFSRGKLGRNYPL